MPDREPFDPDLIRGIAFSGGGGKVVIMVGAIRALEYAGVIAPGRRGTAFSGASTGAIPAALLACGVTATDVCRFLHELPTSFYSEQSVSVSRPSIRAAATGLAFETDPKQEIRAHGPFLDLLRRWEPALRTALRPFVPPDRVAQAFRRWSEQEFGLEAALVDTILSAGAPSAMNVARADAGLLAWSRLCDQIDGAISAAVQSVTGRPQRGLTFAQHRTIFDGHLCLIATNLRTGRSLTFHAGTTPHLPLAYAARLCSSIPFAVKPVLLTAEAAAMAGASADYVGLWIDGGSLNASGTRALHQLAGVPENSTLSIHLSPTTTEELEDRVDEKALARPVIRMVIEMLLAGPSPRTTATTSTAIQLRAGAISGLGFTRNEHLVREAQEQAFTDVIGLLDACRA